MLSSSAKGKGRRAENKLRDLLKANGISAHRVAGSGAGTHEKGDVESEMPLSWEVKNQKGISKILGWLDQSSSAAEKVHKIPAVAFCERNDEPEWTIVPTRWLIDLWLKSREPKTVNSQDHEFKYWLVKLAESSKKVIKHLEA